MFVRNKIISGVWFEYTLFVVESERAETANKLHTYNDYVHILYKTSIHIGGCA